MKIEFNHAGIGKMIPFIIPMHWSGNTTDSGETGYNKMYPHGMRIIQKQISLEPMTSRLPSVWPAYLDNKLYFFDDAHLKERDWAYTSNWGMVPVNIVVNHNQMS